MLRISKQRARAAGVIQVEPGREGPPDVASNLRRLRQQRGYSLETLARLSGVSRAMLGQIETGKSAPTITLLWKVATALDVAISELIESEKAPRSYIIRGSTLRGTSLSEGKVEIVGYTLPGRPLPFEISQLRVAAGHRQAFPPLATRALALLIVNTGIVSVQAGGGAPEVLETEDAILFEAGQPYEVSNEGAEDAILYLVAAAHGHGRVA